MELTPRPSGPDKGVGPVGIGRRSRIAAGTGAVAGHRRTTSTVVQNGTNTAGNGGYPMTARGARRLPWGASPPPWGCSPRHGAAGPRASGRRPHQQPCRTEPMRRGMGNAPGRQPGGTPSTLERLTPPWGISPHHRESPHIGHPPPWGSRAQGEWSSASSTVVENRTNAAGNGECPPAGSQGARRLPRSASPPPWGCSPRHGAAGPRASGRRTHQQSCRTEPIRRGMGNAPGRQPGGTQSGPGRLVAGMGHAPGREHAPTLEPLIQLEIDHYGVTSYLSGSPRYR